MKTAKYRACIHALICACALTYAFPMAAWEIGPLKGDDPKIELPQLPNAPDIVGDLTHPERIWENIKRETDNVGREIDRIRLAFNAVTTAPLLEAWLVQSRNDAAQGASPIPPEIRQALGSFFPSHIYDKVRFKIGDGGAVNLSNLSINYGEAEAVTLIDVVVFANESGARSPALWAHELWHVTQFHEWGVRDFAIRYLRSWNSVEDDAYAASNRFVQTAAAPVFNPPPIQAPSPPIQIPAANQMPVIGIPVRFCRTPVGTCEIPPAMVPMGTSCYCDLGNGNTAQGAAF